MGHKLCTEQNLRANWIDVIRLALALLVIFSHSYPLTQGSNANEPLIVLSRGQKSFGMVAIDLFFVISGFLIVRSWLNCHSMQDYFRRRVLRIHPGFALAVIVSAILAAVSSTSAIQYFHQLAPGQLFASLFTLHYGSLDNPAAFPGNPFSGVNGSLWTIPLEFGAYIGVAAYGLFGMYRFRWLGAALAVFAYADFALKVLRHGEGSIFWELSCCFISGASFFLFRDLIPRTVSIFAGAIATLGASIFVPPYFQILIPGSAAYILFYLALTRPPARTLQWTKYIDLSYGTYLYAYVIQQCLVYWLNIRSPMILFAAAVPLSLGCATISWFAVERPCLQMKRHKFLDFDRARTTSEV